MNSNISKISYLIELYEIYKKLLTLKQQSIFYDYYFLNLSISEISENNNTSRNAAFLTIKNADKKLIDLEDKLKIYEKSKKISNLLDSFEKTNNLDIITKIKEIL